MEFSTFHQVLQPTYQVTITNKADENDVIVLEPQLTAQVVLSNLQLTAGATYEFSVVALGDHSGEEDDMWYSDSLAGKVNFSYTENFKASDFRFIELMDGDFLPETELGANNSLIIKDKMLVGILLSLQQLMQQVLQIKRW